MTQLQAPERPMGRPLSHLDEAERYRSFDDLQLAMPSVWESMRLGVATNRSSRSPRSASSAPPLGVVPSCKRWRNAHCSCCCYSANRGYR